MEAYLLIGLGGALGAILRYSTYLSFRGMGFPWATLVVNVIGSFLLALILFMPMGHGWVSSPMITVGVLGAFTTFSSFSLDTVLLYEERGPRPAMLNITLNLTLCIAAAVLGMLASPALF